MLLGRISGERLFFFLSGIVVGVPVALLFEVTSHLWFTTLGVATIVAPVVEEFAKANPLFYRYERTAKSLMLFGFLAGLGFGLAEFFVYVLRGVPFLLRLPAIGFHAAGTSIVGYGVSKRSTLRYYFLAVGLHFLNNLFASLGLLWLIGGLGATFASYYLAWKFHGLASRIPADSSSALTARFCFECGSKLSPGTRFCQNCGANQQLKDRTI
jgi:RsiW-degrading membrane proteinase PrsW (M82 family)